MSQNSCPCARTLDTCSACSRVRCDVSTHLCLVPVIAHGSHRAVALVLPRGVAQFMLVKPVVIISMALLLMFFNVVANEMRVLSIMSLIVAIEALTQVGPRLSSLVSRLSSLVSPCLFLCLACFLLFCGSLVAGGTGLSLSDLSRRHPHHDLTGHIWAGHGVSASWHAVG